jgi:aconitate hydratase
VGMGILPLQFKPGESAESHGLTGHEKLTIRGLAGEIRPRQDVAVEVERKDGAKTSFAVTARLDTPVDINYYRNGGILQTVLRKMVS